MLQFPFYDRIFRYSMKKSKWPELVAKAQDDNLKLATPMVKAWICYEVENNYWTWMYNWYSEVLPSKKGRDGKLPKACDLLKTDYDISSSNAEEEEDDTGHRRYIDELGVEVKFDVREDCYEIIPSNDLENYAKAKNERIQRQIELAKSNPESEEMLRKVCNIMIARSCFWLVPKWTLLCFQDHGTNEGVYFPVRSALLLLRSKEEQERKQNRSAFVLLSKLWENEKLQQK